MAQNGISPQKDSQWKRVIGIHIGIIVAFLVVISIYFKPAFQGEVLSQSDIAHFQGMSKELSDFRAESGEEALWTTRMFGGMPAFQISVLYKSNLFNVIDKIFRFGLPRPVNYIFLMFLGFFFLLRVLKVNPYISGIGAAAFALSSYFFIIMEPGHTSKANAIAYMAPVIAGVILTFRGKLLLGGAITAFFLALEINANHFQITYYLALTLIVLGIVYLVDAIRNKEFLPFAQASGALILAAILAVGPNIGRIWTTYEYADATIRGKPVLTDNQNPTGDSGLDIEYALRWSYGISESFTLMIPNYFGGASYSELPKNSATVDFLSRSVGRKNAERYTERWPTYWGDQPFTSGPVYVGAIVCFLFVLGLLMVPGRIKWWLLATTVLFLVLSWGRNFPLLTELFFYYFPGYNKFRAVSMMLVIPEFTMPLLGALGLYYFVQHRHDFEEESLQKNLFLATGIAGGLCLLIALVGPFLLSFSAESSFHSDSSTLSRMLQVEKNSPQLQDVLDALYEDRATMLRNDAFRSTAFILLVAGILWFFLKGTIKENILYIGLGILILFDMVPINLRYLNADSFERRRAYEQQFQPTKASQSILQDKDPHYRVLNLTGDTFNESKTSYHHRSVGGYHAAKLRRYQDLISRHISPEIQAFISSIRAQQSNLDDSTMREIFKPLHTLNMLNTRYIIINPDQPPVRNPNPYGPVWYVSNTQIVSNPNEEIAALNEIDPRETAIINEQYRDMIRESYEIDGNAKISLKEYRPNYISYESTSAQEGLAIFSEVYYNDKKGWHAYIDGERVPHLQANYVFRGLVIPAGNHEVVFKFEPQSYRQGERLSLIFSIILIGVVIGVLIYEWQMNRKREQTSL